MTQPDSSAWRSRPATWSVVFAFGLLYLSWGTTYFAIREGVKDLPPALFGGVRLGLAGLLLLSYCAVRGLPFRLTSAEWLWTTVGGFILFAGGNGLITAAEQTVDSGVASVLVTTTPLWMALLEVFWPGGERLTLRGWLGLAAGTGGVLLLLAPTLQDPAAFLQDTGPMLVLGSAFAWALGTLILRDRSRPDAPASKRSPFTMAGYQMFLGGTGLSVIGLFLGEGAELTADRFTPRAVLAFFYLLVVGSLIGFVAYSWLLGHVSTALVGTYAYVNPVVAIFVGAFLGGEVITSWIVAGMVLILAAVALVRWGGVRPAPGRRAEGITADPPPNEQPSQQRAHRKKPATCGQP